MWSYVVVFIVKTLLFAYVPHTVLQYFIVAGDSHVHVLLITITKTLRCWPSLMVNCLRSVCRLQDKSEKPAQLCRTDRLQFSLLPQHILASPSMVSGSHPRLTPTGTMERAGVKAHVNSCTYLKQVTTYPGLTLPVCKMAYLNLLHKLLWRFNKITIKISSTLPGPEEALLWRASFLPSPYSPASLASSHPPDPFFRAFKHIQMSAVLKSLMLKLLVFISPTFH